MSAPRPHMDHGALLDDGLRHVIATHCSQPHPVYTPHGPQFVRCWNRRRDRCPGCSAISVGDWQAIIRSGIFDAGAEYRFFFLTLTAPSFGSVHRVAKPGHRRSHCRCGVWHSDATDAHLRGLPIDPETYDYVSQVDWNAASSRLFDATRARLRTAFPSLAFASVREWQARGALHLHVLIRVHVHDSSGTPATADGSEPALTAITRLAAGVSSHTDLGLPAVWGANIDCRPMGQDDSTGQVIWYLTKAVGYMVKDVADGGGATSTGGRAHWERMSQAARQYRCASCQGETFMCSSMLHRQWGARSHVISVSRPSRDGSRPGWSLTGLTRTSQRAERARWAESNSPVSAEKQARISRERAAIVEQAAALLEARKRREARVVADRATAEG